MTDLSKFISIPIGDIQKIFGIPKSQLSKVYGYNIPTAAPGIGDRGVFMGGWTSVSIVDIEYITVSTTGNGTDFGDLTQITSEHSATSNGASDRGVCGGGVTTAGATTNVIEAITISSIGNASDIGDLTEARRASLGACSNNTNDRGVWAGGNNGGYSNVIDYITISTHTGTATDFGDLLVGEGRRNVMGTSNGTNDRGIFAGGREASPTYVDIITYITISSAPTATDFGDLTQARRGYDAGVSNGTNNRGCFMGGNASGGVDNTIDYITISSAGNALNFGDLTTTSLAGGATDNQINNRGVRGGGTGPANTIDYITISSLSDAQDFGDLLVAKYQNSGCSNA